MVPVLALLLLGAEIRLGRPVYGPYEELSGSVKGLAGEDELIWEDPEGKEFLRMGLRPGSGGTTRFAFPPARARIGTNVLRLGSGARVSFTVRPDPFFSAVEALWEEKGEWRASSGREPRRIAGPLVLAGEFLPSREDVDALLERFRLRGTAEPLVRRPCLSGAGFREKLKTLARERADSDAWGTILFEELAFLPSGAAADLCFCDDCTRACAGRGLPAASTLDEARQAGSLEGWCAHRLFMSSLPGEVDLGEFVEPGAMGVELCGAYSVLPGSLKGLSWCSFKDGLSAWAASGLVPGLKVVAPSRQAWEPGLDGFLGKDHLLPRALRSYLARADIVWDDVAVVCSPESALASYALDASRASLPFRPPAPFKETWRKALASWALLLRDCSFDPRAVPPGRVPANGMLVLPRTCALSEAACREVRSFASRGGTVVADSMTALYDERCRKRPRGGLDALFGIRRKEAVPAELCGRVYPLGVGRPKWQRTTDPAGLLMHGRPGGLSAGEKDVSLEGGVAAARARETYAFIARREGAGLAAFLNVCVTLYPEMRKRPEGKLLREVVRALAGEAQVRPKARVLGQRIGPRARTLEWGGSFLVWLRGEGLAGSKVELDCPFLPFVYDALTGEFLGRSHTVALEGPDERYLSLLPARVSPIIAPLTEGGKAARGSGFSFELRMKGSKANHLAELRLYGPSGDELEKRRRILVLKRGGCEFGVYFAPNDPPGLWKIEVDEALTRSTGSTRLVVE